MDEDKATFGAKVETGLDWETVVQYAVMMRCVLVCKDSADRGPFDIVPAAECPEFIYISVPGEHKTVDAVMTYVKKRLGQCGKHTLVMVNSQFAKLPVFDGFVWYHVPVANDATGVALHKIIGYQCKLGREGTS